jgi:hypothetical protein
MGVHGSGDHVGLRYARPVATALFRRVTGSTASLLLMLAATGCSRPPEAPAVRLDGAYLIVENLTGQDVHVQLVADPMLQAWIPASLPGNRIEHRRHLRLRIAPSVRGQAAVLAWWHPGKPIGDSGIAGPDKVRRIRLSLDPLPQPLPADEQVVLACIEASRALIAADRIEEDRSGRRLDRKRLQEGGCMDDAEQACFRGNECASRLQHWQLALAQARQIVSQAPAR